MKTATEKSHLLLSLCTSLLLATTTFASDSGYDGGDDENRPPLTPKTAARFTAYPKFFDEIAALGPNKIKINDALRSFIRANFKKGEPTLAGLVEFRSQLAAAQESNKVSTELATHIGKSLDVWHDHILTLLSDSTPSAPSLGAASSADDRAITPLALTPARPSGTSSRVGSHHRRVLGDTNTAAGSDTMDPALLRLIKSHLEDERRGRIGRPLRVFLPPLRLEDRSDEASASSPKNGAGDTSISARAAVAESLPSIPDILTYLNERIIGEETAMEALTVGVHSYYKTLEVNEGLAAEGSEERVERENILVCGPTGCGKTASVKALAKKLNRLFFEGDASGLTRTGYVGDSAVSLIAGLIQEAKSMVTDELHGSPAYMKKVLDLVHKGIIFVDEVDKLASKKSGSERDIAGSDVQAELLKLTEGKKVTITFKDGSFPPETYEIDTSKILFIGGGAFTGLPKKDDGVYAPNDFVEAGFKPELLGRFGNMVFLEGMTQEKFEKILASPEASPIRKNLLLLERGYNVHVKFDTDALKLIAERAYERETGVRGLASMVKAALRPLIVKAASRHLTTTAEEDGGETVTIDKAFVEKAIPKVTKVKKDDRPPVGTFERYILDNPEPPAGMFM